MGELDPSLRFDEHGLLPVVVQDVDSGDVLMLAYANAEALQRTRASGMAWFYSRSRQRLWQKGERSGNVLHVREVRYDCDEDAVLYRVHAAGPACHTGAASCFYRTAWQGPSQAGGPGREPAGLGDPSFLVELAEVVRQRLLARPQGSYVADLFAQGRDRILQKVGEEAVETVLAGKNEAREPFVAEAADLVFHLTVALEACGAGWREVVAELQRRHAGRG